MTQMRPPNIYPPIADWSHEGRRQLVEEHGDRIRLLLDNSFTAFADDYSLAEFGFRHPDDLITEAVEWVVHRFAHGDVDSRRITDRTFRLFTRVPFWLQQKVGKENYSRIMSRLRQHPDEHPQPARDEARAEQDEALEAFAHALAQTLRELHQRTCPDLVGFWLRASDRFRARLFAWHESAILSEAGQTRSAKERSLHEHDALLRFLALHYRQVPDVDRDPASKIVVASMFSSCPNRPPRYLMDDREVIARLRDPAIASTRVVKQFRKQGLCSLIHACIDLLEACDETPTQRLERMLGLVSLGRTTLHAYRIDDPVLAVRVHGLPRLPAEIAR